MTGNLSEFFELIQSVVRSGSVYGTCCDINMMRQNFEATAFAGLIPFNKKLETRTFIIVTLAASPQIEHIHNRMPVILKGDVLSAWMDPKRGKEDALSLLQENRGTDLVYHPVSKAVGAMANKGPELIDPIQAVA